MSLVCLTGWLAFLYNKHLNVGYYSQTFQQIIFIPAMHIGTIDFYHFLPLSLTLTLSGISGSVQSKTSWLHVLPHFWTDQDEMWSGLEANQVQHLDTMFQWDVLKHGEINAVLLSTSKNSDDGMDSNVYELIWFKLCRIIDTIKLYILILVLLTLTQGHRSARKQKLLRQLSIWQSFQSVWIEFDTLLRCVGAINLLLIFISSI